MLAVRPGQRACPGAILLGQTPNASAETLWAPDWCPAASRWTLRGQWRPLLPSADSPAPSGPAALGLGAWEGQGEGRAAAGGIGVRDRASVSQGHRRRDGQAEPGTSTVARTARVGTVEAVEDVLDMV